MLFHKTEGDESLKITIHTDENVREMELTVTCSHMTPKIEKLLAMVRMMDMQLTGIQGGETYLIDISSVLYIDTVDKKTFLYTEKQVYESNLKLYELEEQLMESNFFRANKSCIINLKHIVSLRAELDRRILVTMSNGERLIVSRQYADEVKRKLGVR